MSDPEIPPVAGTLDDGTAEASSETTPEPSRKGRGLQITLALLIVIVCLELGLFLLVFPWTDYWTSNYFATFIPQYFWVWENAYFRGAVSGLGVVNLCICFSEIIRLRRFSANQ